MAAHLVELHVGFGSEQALQKLVDTFAHGTRPAQSLCLYATHGAVLLELCDLEIDIGARHVGHGGAYRHGRLALAHHALYRRIVLVRDHRVSTTSCSSVNCLSTRSTAMHAAMRRAYGDALTDVVCL